MKDDWRVARGEFARRIAEVGQRRHVLVDPTFDHVRFRLLDAGRAIDLYNPWCQARTVTTGVASTVATMIRVTR